MSKAIEKISLHHFRGATKPTELTFASGKVVVMIFGENGTGKTTLIDSIDLILNRTAGSLDGRTKTPGKHLASIGQASSSIAVEITCGGQKWEGSHAGREPVISGPSSPPVAHVLRRKRLLRLIEARPAERFEELKRFIDVQQIEECERTLNLAARSANKRLDDAIKSKQDADDALTEIWQSEGQPGGIDATPQSWARAKVSADFTETQRKAALIEKLLQIVQRAQTTYNNWNDAAEAVAVCDQEVIACTRRLAQSGADSGEASRMLQFLQQVKALIAPQDTSAECPACSQPIDIAGLRGQIDIRINALGEMLDLLQRHFDAVQCRNAASVESTRSQRAWIEVAKSLAAEAKALSTSFPDLLSIEWSDFPALIAAHVADPLFLAEAHTLLEVIVGEKPRLKQSGDDAQKDAAQYNLIKPQYARIQKSDENIVELNAVHERLDQALKTVRQIRVAFTQSVLDDIADECKRLYGLIHPNEALWLSGFRLEGRASLLDDAHFQGHADVPPQVYFSESHLDTYGFCLFLALAKRYGVNIVVLDDVFTSVDHAHLSRIMDLLTDESKNFDQIIITTHYRYWRDRYSVVSGPAQKIEFIELAEWTLDHGIQIYKSKLAVEELKGKMASLPFDRQSVASKAGILLEAALDRLALLYRCSVPRTDANEYTLSDLTGAVTAVAKKVKVKRPKFDGEGNLIEPPEVEELMIKETLDAIKAMTFIRNKVGCHFGSQGGNVSDSEVRELGRETLNLVTTLVCFNCGNLPERNKGTHFECPCSKTRLEPAQVR